MALSTWAMLAAIPLIIWVGFKLVNLGKISERQKYDEGIVKANRRADALRRAIERESDPGARLRDEWRRPVLPDSPTDSDIK